MKKFFSKFKVNIIVFFIPVFIYLLTYIIFGVYPFKDKIILISDMYSQYIHYYIYIYDSISNLDFFSLIYSWNIGLGNSFIGLFSSYLSSPLNLIILLFPKKNLTEAIFIITILKIGFSAVSFSFFLNYLHKDNKSYCIIFSVLYSLMSYMVVYSFNIMWLDSVIYLPLVAMGINKIVKEKKFILYCISLFLTIISNYYTGYMVCIFSILYFLIVYFSVNDLKDVKIFLHRFKLFIISSLLAGILSSYLIIPTYFSLKNTNSFGSGNLEMKANYDFIDLFSKMIINSYDTLTVGLPNVYCGLIVLILVPLYFFNTKYSIKEKILYFIFIVFLIFSFNISAFNIIWHGFDYPNWFPYRYSFIFSFILLKLAFKAFVELKNIKFFIIVGYTSILILTIIVIQKLDYDFINDISITLSILIILVYTTLLSLFKINFKKNIYFFILIIVLSELVINTFYMVYKMDNEFKYSNKEEYMKIINFRDAIDKINNKKDFYRIEKDEFISYNDSMSMNYNGVTHYSSLSYQNLNRSLEKLGLSTNYILAINYIGSTKITDSLLGVKYFMTYKDNKSDYKLIENIDRYNVFENINYVPLGFLSTKDMEHINFNENPFINQNNILNRAKKTSLSNNDEYINFFKPVNILEKKVENLKEEVNHFKRVDNSKKAYIEYRLKINKNQQVYSLIRPKSNLNVFVNNQSVDLKEQNEKSILDLGIYSDEDIVVKILLNNDETTFYETCFYSLDLDSSNSALKKIKDLSLKDLEVKSTYVKGFVEAEKDDILFMSIPYDPSWKVSINGNESDVISIGDAFLGARLVKGKNSIKFTYKPQGIIVGFVCSGSSIIILIILFKLKKSKE